MSYTDQEFAEKIEWEGGLWVGLLDYGLSSAALEDKQGELFLALVELESITNSNAFKNAVRRVEEALPEERWE